MSRPPTIPDEDKPLIFELLQTLTAIEVGEKWDVHRSVIQRFINRFGFSVAEIKSKHRLALVRKYKDTHEMQDIAKMCKCHPDTLRREVLVNK